MGIAQWPSIKRFRVQSPAQLKYRLNEVPVHELTDTTDHFAYGESVTCWHSHSAQGQVCFLTLHQHGMTPAGILCWWFGLLLHWVEDAVCVLFLGTVEIEWGCFVLFCFSLSWNISFRLTEKE